MHDLTGEAGKYRLDLFAGRMLPGGGRNLPFEVVRRPLLAPLGGEAVDFPAIHGMGDGLGRLPQRDGEEA